MPFSDSIHWTCGAQEGPLVSETAVGTSVFSHPGAAQGCPKSLADHTDLTTSSLQSLTSHFKARREETSYKQSNLFLFQGKISVFVALVWCNHKQPLSLWKTIRRGVSWNLSGWLFSCSVMPEELSQVKETEFLGPFCSSHYSFHCLKSNSRSAFSAREEINFMGVTFSSWNIVNICQLRADGWHPFAQ